MYNWAESDVPKENEKNDIKKQEQFSQKIDELNQETDNLLNEFDKWQT